LLEYSSTITVGNRFWNLSASSIISSSPSWAKIFSPFMLVGIHFLSSSLSFSHRESKEKIYKYQF
jgi:hypothetical protein